VKNCKKVKKVESGILNLEERETVEVLRTEEIEE
jgi:hypothetical protein